MALAYEFVIHSVGRRQDRLGVISEVHRVTGDPTERPEERDATLTQISQVQVVTAVHTRYQHGRRHAPAYPICPGAVHQSQIDQPVRDVTSEQSPRYSAVTTQAQERPASGRRQLL